MNKYYVLNNSNDTTLYYKDGKTDTRVISESKRFTDRRLAEKFIRDRNLSESFDTKAIIDRHTKSGKKGNIDIVMEDIKSAIDDSKDIIDTTLELIDTYRSDDSLKEEIEGACNISEIADKLEKIKKYMNGIAFTPSFDNSLGSAVGPGSSGGDPIE